jgi:hypothetical protein
MQNPQIKMMILQASTTQTILLGMLMHGLAHQIGSWQCRHLKHALNLMIGLFLQQVKFILLQR